MPGMCPTPGGHTTIPSETTPVRLYTGTMLGHNAPYRYLTVAHSSGFAEMPSVYCSSFQPGSPSPSVTEHTKQLEPVIQPAGETVK